MQSQPNVDESVLIAFGAAPDQLPPQAPIINYRFMAIDFRDSSVEHVVRENIERVRELMAKLGYENVSDLQALGLTEEQIKQLRFAGHGNSGDQFFTGARADGTKAQAIIQAQANRYVAAEVFSPALVGGHANNNDFIWDAELQPILEKAIRDEARTK